MRTLTILLSLFIGTAMAQDFERAELSFRIDSRTVFGGRVFYSCDSVKDQTKFMLKKLGAQQIDLRCTGGIDPFGGFAREAFVRTEFSAPTEGDFQSVEFTGFDGCHLANEIFKNIKDSFTLQNVENARNCFRSNDPYTITLEVLK